MAEERTAGAIYDIGYQHYDGVRLGRANAIRTLIAFSFRSAFGVGRGSKAQQIPVIVCVVLFGAALLEVAISVATGSARLQMMPAGTMYAQHFQLTAFFVAIFTAAQAPEMIVTESTVGDDATLPRRALRASTTRWPSWWRLRGGAGDDAGARTASLCREGDGERDALAAVQGGLALGPIVGGALLAACYMASVGLGLAAYTARRASATAAVITFFVLVPAVSGIVMNLVQGDARRFAPRESFSGAGWLWQLAL